MGILDEPEFEAPEIIDMAPGDLFVLLTDGFYEYQDHAGEQFGNDGVEKAVAENADRSAEEVLATLLKATETFADGALQKDDLTAIVIRREPAGG